MAARRPAAPQRQAPAPQQRRYRYPTQRRPPTRLNSLNRPLLFRALSYLIEADRIKGLAAAGIRLPPKKAAQQVQSQGKQQQAARTDADDASKPNPSAAGDEGEHKGDETSPPSEDPKTDNSTATDDAAVAEDVDQKKAATDDAAVAGDSDENKVDTDGAAVSEDSDQKKAATSPDKEMKAAPAPRRRMAPFAAPPDPDTLLARLNTRRLCKRIVHSKKGKKSTEGEGKGEVNVEEEASESSLVSVYPKNMTVEEIAMEEWENLLRNAKKRNNGEDQENAQPPIPSPYELLLFSPCPRAVTVLASYPRSGNSLLRTLFERTTLRVTGSDMRGGLAKHDLVGEAAVSANKVQFVKTHYPERRGQPAFRASRVVLLVRNPYDAIESFYNLMMTGTHTTSVTDEMRKKTEKVWAEMALKEMHVWKAFHEFWLDQDVPLLLVRYEDLIRNPDQVMSRVVRFVLEIRNMGSFFTERIDRCIREEQIERLGSYKPRSGGIGKSLSKYSPELLQEMNFGALDIMERLGYGEMLVPNREDWEKLAPLDKFGVEFAPKSTPVASSDGHTNTLVINGGTLARGPEQRTDWRVVKKDLGVGNAGQCQCYRCTSGR